MSSNNDNMNANPSSPRSPNSPRPTSPRHHNSTVSPRPTSPSHHHSPRSSTSSRTEWSDEQTAALITSSSRTEWSDEQTAALIEQRRTWNYEYYYSIPGRNRKKFWNSIAESINSSCGCNYSGKQCQIKFNGLVSNYHVS
jgi:hypothetical protein